MLLCLLVGVKVSEIPTLGHSPLWTLFGTVALYILYYLPTWQGYAGKDHIPVVPNFITCMVLQVCVCVYVVVYILCIYIYIYLPQFREECEIT